MAAYPLNLNQLVTLFLPAGFSVSPDFISQNINKWQLLLWDSFSTVVLPDDKYDITKYPEESLNLFASLVVYEVMQVALTGNFLEALNSATTAESGSSSSGGVKSIKTGPTEVEYHDSVTAFSKLMSNAGAPGGIMELLTGQTCMYASQWGIKLPWCLGTKTPIPLIKVQGKVPRPFTKYLRKKGGYHG